MDFHDTLQESLYIFSRYLVAEDFLDLLIKDNVLSLDDKELITNQFIHQTRRQRATKLIEVLMLRDKSSYDKFMEYVEYLYPHVFTMVTNKEPRHPPPDLKRNRDSDKLRLINDLPNLAQQIKDQWHLNTELDSELTVLKHILEFAKEENQALEKEIVILKDARYKNDALNDEFKTRISDLERENNKLQVQMNEEMRQALSYIKERDELQEKLRELQIRYDDQYNQLKELQQRSANTSGSPSGAVGPQRKPPLPDKKPLEQKIAAHIDMAKKILTDKLADAEEKCEELSQNLQDKLSEIDRLEEQVNKKDKEMKKMSKEKKNMEKQLADSIVKSDSYFEIIQKKDKELLENQSQKMKEESKYRELLQSKNELFEQKHQLEKRVDDLQRELDKIKARQSSSSVDMENSSPFNSASEEGSGEDHRQNPVKKKTFREGRYSVRKAVFGEDAFTNIKTPGTSEYEEYGLQDYYKASTMPATINETPEMVFRRECAMFRYTMKSKKAKEEMTHSINVEPSDSIKRNPNKRDNDFDLGIFGTRTGSLDPADANNHTDASSGSTILVHRAPNTGQPKHLTKKKSPCGWNITSSSQSEDDDEDFDTDPDCSSTTTNESNDYCLSSDLPCWEVSTHILPKSCVRVNRPGLPDKDMCREVLLKYPVIDDKILIKGGNHTGIFIYKVLKSSNLYEGEEIKGIVYVPSQRNVETTASLEGCTLEETYKLLSQEYIVLKKEKDVKIKVQNCSQEYDSACKWMERNAGTGDYIFVRCNMNVDGKASNEINLKQGDIYLVTNTMFDQQKWLGKKIDEATGTLDPQEVVLPNLQQANLRRFPSGTEKRRGVVKLKGQCYDRVLPMTATVKLPVYVVGPEKIVSAVIGLITTDLSSTFVKIEKDSENRTSSEQVLQDVHFVTDGLSDTKSQPKSCRKIYIFINVTSALPDERYKALFGTDFPSNSLDDPVSRSERIKQHLISNSISYEDIVLDSITSREKLVSMVKHQVATSQKRLIWLSADEMDPSIAKKYVKYLGQDLGQVMCNVQRANSLDTT